MSGPELCGSPKISGHFYAAGRACPAPTVLPYKKREQKSPFTLFWHSCGLAIQVFLVLEGVPGVLDIIIVVQGVQQLAHLGGGKNPTRNNLVLVTERMREQPFDNDELQPINKRLKDILP